MDMPDNTTLELIAYGGAFDPPHVGHLGCVEAALNQFPKAKIWIVPGYTPAGLQLTKKHTQASYDDRLKMCALNFEPAIKAGGGRVVISEIERSLPAPNYTVQTIRAIREQVGDKNIGFLIGADQLHNFHLWNHPEIILSLSSLVVVSRKGENQPDPTHGVTALTKTLSMTGQWNHNRTIFKFDDTDESIFLIDVEVSDAASGKIREHFQKKAPLNKQWLQPKVQEYIQNQHLYAGPTQETTA